MTTTDVAALSAFIDACPSPYHATAEVARHLEDAGFVDADARHDDRGTPGETAPLPLDGYRRDGGLLIAWRAGGRDADAPRRIIGAHTDSPNLRIKPHPDLAGSGMRRLAAEPYGGALLNSWLDRDLGLSGRVAVRTDGDQVAERLFRVDEPILRVPQLAIHLDREITTAGLLLDKQRHLNPVWGLGTPEPGAFAAWLAGIAGVDARDLLGWDAMCHDLMPSHVLGVDSELLAAPRLDNLCSSFGAMRAFVGADSDAITVIALFDHEEIGSETATGAASPRLEQVLDDLDRALGLDPSAVAGVRARSRVLSADMAHATHPNYPERHEPLHTIALGGGPVVKVNVNGRYATDARTGAEFVAVCDRADLPVQTYANRADMACGSTIGPITAARLGIPTVDVGMAQLSMHSAREMMACADVDHMVRAFTTWIEG